MNPTRNLPPHYPAGVVMALAVLAAVAAFASKACRKLAQIATLARPFDAPGIARHMLLGAIFGAALGLAQVGAGCTASGQLTPAAESGILAGELAICEGATAALLPSATFACPGSEAMLKLALDKVTATTPAPDAGSATGQAAAAVVAAAPTHPTLRTRRGYAVWHGTTCLGYVPLAATARAIHTPAVQAYLTSVAPLPPRVLPLVDAGAGEGGR